MTFLTCEKNHPTNQRSQTIFLTSEEKVSNFPANFQFAHSLRNGFLSEFIIKVRTKQNKDYELNSLRVFLRMITSFERLTKFLRMITSFERHLKKKNYGLSIMKDLQFEQTRKALVSKQKNLKRQGKREYRY